MINRVMIAADKSGSGKTTVTCALLAALKKRNMDIRSFKCGPDYIDPMFHNKVIGIPAKNLDPFFCNKEDMINSLCGEGDNYYALIEGAMGIYDGLGGVSVMHSAYEVAGNTQTPIILVLDAKGMGRTLISVIRGILADDNKKLIAGLILNRISENYYKSIRTVIEQETGIKCLGFLPKSDDVIFESRHLGLKLPYEIDNYSQIVDKLSIMAGKTIDIDGIINLMSNVSALIPKHKTDKIHIAQNKLRLAVAMDDAFCFYYRDNFASFEKRNVSIVPFSPIKDNQLPDDIDGVLFGGGYPELKALELSNNISMLESVRKAINSGIPSLAECGGFMYLHEYITDINKNRYRMASVIKGECNNTGKLGRFGYIDLHIKEGLSLKAHEFHYYDSTDCGNDCSAIKPLSNREWKCCHLGSNYLWGFPHLYYPSAPLFVDWFVKEMEAYSHMRDENG